MKDLPERAGLFVYNISDSLINVREEKDDFS